MHSMYDHAKIALIPSVEVLDYLLDPNERPTRGTFTQVMEKVFASAEYAAEDQEKVCLLMNRHTRS